MARVEAGIAMAISIGVIGLVTTTLGAAALAWPASLPARLLNLAPSHEARAHALTAGPDATVADLALARQETMKSLRQAPSNATAWLRLAYIDSRSSAGLGPGGVRALERSYVVAPFGPDDTDWRLRFAFNHWTRLDTVTRRLVLDELRVHLHEGEPAGWALMRDVRDPAGYLAVGLTARTARMTPPVD